MICKRFFSLWLPLGMAAALLASCKEQTVTPVDEPAPRVKAAHTKRAMTSLQGIPCFDSSASFDSIAQVVHGMTYAERTAYEQSMNYKSYGTICDSAYNALEAVAIRAEKAKPTARQLITLQKAWTAQINKSPYLQLVVEDGEKYVETDEYDNPDRYLMDAKKMYVVKDEAFRYFDTVQIVVAKKDLNVLRNALKASDVPPLSVVRRCSMVQIPRNWNMLSATSNGPLKVDLQNTNGKYRLKVRMYAQISSDWSGYRLYHILRVDNYRKFGFWWHKRLLTKVDAGFKTCLDDQICKSNGGTTAELCTFQCHERFKTTTRKSDPFFLGNQIITPPNLHVNSYYCTASNSEGCIINVNAR